MAFLKSVFAAISSNLNNIFVYIIILAVFIVGLVYCILPVLRCRNRLRSATRNIKAGTKAKRSWQEDDFLGKGALMPHWSAYLNNLFFADGEYHNASNVEDFINEETAIYGPGRSAFSEAVPSLLVSLGFLGTLIGLAQGLSGFDMTDMTAASNSIAVLIPGMKYAFMTSIFGVVGSVLFTLLTRASQGSAEHALKSFYGALSDKAGVVSVDPMTQIAIYQQEQTAMIRTMATDLNGRFVENMSTAIRDSIEPMNQNLRSFMTATSKEQLRFLDVVTERFVDRMDEVLGDRLSGFARVLDQTTRQQEEAFAAIRDGMRESEQAVRDLREVQRVTGEMVDTLNAFVADVRKASGRAAESNEHMAEAIAQMDTISRAQGAYLTKLQTELNRWMESFQRASDSFMRGFERENDSANEAMKQAAASLNSAAGKLADIQESAAAALSDEMDRTMEDYRGYVNQFTQRVDYLASNISEAVAQLPKAVNESTGAFLDQIDRITDTMDQAQRALQDAADRLYR